MRSDWSVLLTPGSPDWANLKDDPRADRVKANDGREVWRVQLGSRVVFAKISRPPRRWARLRRLFFGCDAAREWRIAQYAAAHGLRTVCPVGMAEAPLNGRAPTSILITEGLPDAKPLADFAATLDSSRPGGRALKLRLIDAVAHLIAQAHQCGFEHFDLHAGNVLVDHRPDDSLRLLFVDLHNVRVGRPVDDTTVAGNLCQFNQWFRTRAPLTDRMRFLRRYLVWREALESGPLARRLGLGRRDLIRAIDAVAERHARGLFATRDRRVMRTGRYFARLDLAGGWRAHVFLASKHRVAGSRASELVFTVEQWRAWLKDPLQWVQPVQQRNLIKDSAATTVCRAQLPHPAGPLDVICKRSNGRNLYKRVQYLFRPSRPMMTWSIGNALLHRQIPTARPLAVLERRRFGLVVDSLVITEYVQNACDLDSLLTVSMRDLSPAEQRRLKLQVSSSLVVAVRSLLVRGYWHRDFKAPNVIVQWHPTHCPRPRIVLVDLDGVRPAMHAARRLLPMLVRLNVSLEHCRRVTRADRLRFLRDYLSHFGRLTQPWKPLWRTIEASSARVGRARERRQAEKFRKYGRF